MTAALAVGTKVQHKQDRRIGTVTATLGSRLRVAWPCARLGSGDNLIHSTVQASAVIVAGSALPKRQKAGLIHGQLNPRARELARLGATAAQRDGRAGNHSAYAAQFTPLDSWEQELFAAAYDALIDRYAPGYVGFTGTGSDHDNAVRDRIRELQAVPA